MRFAARRPLSPPSPRTSLEPWDLRRKIGLVAGPALFALLWAIPISSLQETPHRALAVAVWMAVWWLTEAIPLAATALLPLALFPFLGVLTMAETGPSYMDNNIILFFGGMLLAMSMRRWGLDRRIALRIVLWTGTGPRRLVLGFMCATAFLSMWISNTATTMMMLPIALAVIERREKRAEDDEDPAWGVPLLLGVAYGASIGGMATLVGTPTNLVFAAALTRLYPEAPAIDFPQWMMVGLPLVVVLLPLAWLYLTRVAFPLPAADEGDEGRSVLEAKIRQLGPMSYGEAGVACVFSLTALAWIFCTDLRLGFVEIPGWKTLLGLPGANDSTVAVLSAVLLFSIPASLRHGDFLLDWGWARRIPWRVILLFGGGIALARGVADSGLAAWIGSRLQIIEGIPIWVMVAAVCVLMTLLTEITSNTATATVFMPVMAATATALRVDPMLLMIPAALSASCAFMLPVATPPNAIVFGSGKIRMSQMARAGFALNWIGALLIPLLMYLIAVPVLGLETAGLPFWAR